MGELAKFLLGHAQCPAQSIRFPASPPLDDPHRTPYRLAGLHPDCTLLHGVAWRFRSNFTRSEGVIGNVTPAVTGGTKMARRRTERESTGFARKFFTWVALIVFVIWAARNPAQAAALFHTIASAFASMASHVGKHGH
jgi:hypothetical protein